MHERLASLFFPHGAPPEVDASDPERSAQAALSSAASTAHDEQGADLRRVVAGQLLAGDPPEMEAAAVRLLEAGRDAGDVWSELEMASLDAVLGDGAPGEGKGEGTLGVADRSWREIEQRLKANLALLPLPDHADVFDTYLQLAPHPTPPDDLDRAVANRLGVDLDIPMVRNYIESVQDELIRTEALTLIGDDYAVDPEQFLDGLVLTTRIGRRRDRLVLDADLVAFSYQFEPDTTADDEPIDVGPDFERRTVWYGPSDWLADVPEGELATVWMNDGVVHVERAPDELQTGVPSDHGLVALLRGRFDAESEDTGLPLAVRELVVAMRAEDLTCFRRPTPPISELCRSAGLEVRGTWVADGPDQWARQRWGGLLHRVFDEFDEPERQRATPLVLLLGHLVDGAEPGPEQVRAALEALADPALTLDLLRLLPGAEEDSDAVAELARLADVLRPAATRARQRAAVAWLSAHVASRQGDPQRAETLLRDVLVDDPDNADVMDELAWYRSDRGDAEGARSLWLRLEDPPPDLDALPAVEPAGPKLRRNEPCWCGSGRKYKVCHLRITDRAPLPERFSWLLQKSMTYLQRRSGLAVVHLAEAAAIVADGNREVMARAWSDPLVVDVVLAEFGWLQRFLDERGALLPDDERLLVTSWLFAERTVVEVLAVDGPAGLVRVRDLRTGDEHEVLDRSFAPTARLAQLICTRLLDDGQRKRLGIGVLDVPPGRERGLLQILDLEDLRGRGEAVLRWSAAASAPPRLETREAEPVMLCRTRIGPVDPDEAAAVFGADFEPGGDDDQWLDLHELAPDDVIIRATIRLDGTEVVVETNSEQRADRLIDRLLGEFSDAEVLVDERFPIPVDGSGGLEASSPDPGPVVEEPSPELHAALTHFVDAQELRWCDENVPALDGLTPRQAAADPTRREQLERLLASMPEGGVSPFGFASMRPVRLREMLGLR